MAMLRNGCRSVAGIVASFLPERCRNGCRWAEWPCGTGFGCVWVPVPWLPHERIVAGTLPESLPIFCRNVAGRIVVLYLVWIAMGHLTLLFDRGRYVPDTGSMVKGVAGSMVKGAMGGMAAIPFMRYVCGTPALFLRCACSTYTVLLRLCMRLPTVLCDTYALLMRCSCGAYARRCDEKNGWHIPRERQLRFIL